MAKFPPDGPVLPIPPDFLPKETKEEALARIVLNRAKQEAIRLERLEGKLLPSVKPGRPPGTAPRVEALHSLPPPESTAPRDLLVIIHEMQSQVAIIKVEVARAKKDLQDVMALLTPALVWIDQQKHGPPADG